MVREADKAMNGNYVYVGLDLDTTGRRLIDEIVNIAAYTPKAQYSQHIMPLMNLNPGARQRHQIRVINVGCFRMLKSMQTYKVIKTKTEIAALLDFLDWLDVINTKDGVIFVYHDQQKFTPYMMIEAMKKYRLLERFEKIVKSFVNGYDLAGERQGGNGVRYITLCQNYMVQMKNLGMEDKEINEFEGDATVRAKLSYDIVALMAHEGEKKDVDDEEKMATMVNEFVRQKALPLSNEMVEIADQEECISRQSSLREIFRGYFQTSPYYRRRAVTFRRLLAEAKHDMDSLTKIWNEGKREACAELVKKIEEVKEEDREELIELLDAHFDPEKKAVKPVVQRRENNSERGGNMRNPPRRRRAPRGRSFNKENMGPRTDSQRRRRSTDKRNSNNNQMEKTGVAKHQHVDSNQNTVIAAAN